jgi:calcineurin-like phosphoesterase family protein
MDVRYLVELRIGPARWKISETTRRIARAFGITEYIEKIPHLTLFGPFTLAQGIDEQRLLQAIEAIACGYAYIPFTIDGWGMKKGLHGWVAAYAVTPSDDLIELRTSLAGRLQPFASTENVWDKDPSKAWFHITLANCLPYRKAQEVWKGLTGSNRPGEATGTKRPASLRMDVLERFVQKLMLMRTNPHRFRSVFIDQDAVRITVFRGDLILAEYDLPRKVWLYRDAALSRDEWQATLGRYRQSTGIELAGPLDRKKDVYFLGDTHFGHANIIRYCARPFVSSCVHEMDGVLTNNWNRTVGPDDTVYFLGDLRYGRVAGTSSSYLQKLNGRIIFIKGNHDSDIRSAVESVTFEYDGTPFLLIHDPLMAPRHFEGWVIHGHMHNNDLKKYPLINHENRTINVSVEVTGYRPLPLSTICGLIRGDYGKVNHPTLFSLCRTMR